MKCKFCGAEFPDWLDFCPECTRSVDEAAPETEAPASAPAAPAPAPEPQPKPEPVRKAAPAAPAEPEPEDDDAEEDEEDLEPEVYQSPERPRKSRRRKKRGGNRFLWFLLGILFTAAVAAALWYTGIFPKKEAQEPVVVSTESSFSKPADALTAYAKGPQDGDLEEMLKTFAADSYLQHVPTAQNYDVNYEEGEVLRVWGASAAELYKAGTPLSRAIASEKVRSYLLDRILEQFTFPLYHSSSYYGYDADNEKHLIYAADEEQMNDFISQLSSTALFQEVTIGEAFEVSDKLSEEAVEAYKAYMEEQKALFSADDAAFYYLPIKVDGIDYLLGMELVQYDGKWYNNDLYLYGININEQFSGNAFGGLIPVDLISSWA